MKRMIPLNEKQRHMTEDSIPLVKRVIYKYITVNETIFGLDYDDLFQEGCLWLCKAARTFNEEKDAKFETYAEKVIANGLRTYCRLTYNKQKRVFCLSDYEDYDFDFLTDSAPMDNRLIEQDVLQLLYRLKSEYSGVAKRGIEAIEWKYKGFSGTDIARMYNVKPNVVGAWISRAMQKLKKNSMFMLWIEDFTEKKVS